MAVATTTALAAAATAGSLYMQKAGARKAANAEKDAAIKAQELANIEAADLEKQGIAQADDILAKARTFRGNQIANQAASGVVVGDGSAQMMVDTVDAMASADALIAIQDSKNKAEQVRKGAAYGVSAATNRASALLTSGTAGALQGLAKGLDYYGTWKAGQKADSTSLIPTRAPTYTTSPAPIGTGYD